MRELQCSHSLRWMQPSNLSPTMFYVTKENYRSGCRTYKKKWNGHGWDDFILSLLDQV